MRPHQAWCAGEHHEGPRANGLEGCAALGRAIVSVRDVACRSPVVQVDVVGVSGHPSLDEGADGEDRESLGADVVECSADEGAADALSLESGPDLGMGEDDQLVGLLVGGVAQDGAVLNDLVPVAFGRVGDVQSHGGYPSHR